MRETAARHGFLEIMERHTWFCFTPRGRAPCGLCNPCHFTILEGMGHRLPAAARLRHMMLRGTKDACRRVAKAVLRHGRVRRTSKASHGAQAPLVPSPGTPGEG
jgi:hypothetical protein